MQPKIKLWSFAFIFLIVLFMKIGASAGESSWVEPSVDIYCKSCISENKQKECNGIYNSFKVPIAESYAQYYKERLDELVNVIECGSCMPARLILGLLDFRAPSYKVEEIKGSCLYADKIFEQCGRYDSVLFGEMKDKFKTSYDNYKKECSKKDPLIPATSQPMSPLRRNLLISGLSLGITGLALVGVGIGLFVQPVQTSASGCSYKGLDSPCFDKLPEQLTGIGGVPLTLGGIALLIGYGVKTAEERRKPTTSLAEPKR